MSGIRLTALLVAVLVSCIESAGAQSAGSTHGSRVRISRAGSGGTLTGELIGISLDSVWLLYDTNLVSIPASEVRRVQVKRKPVGGRQILLWGLVGGTVTGAGLTAACSSYTSGCAGIIVGSVLAWALWSGIWATVAGSSYRTYSVDWLDSDLRAFARFPQGPPRPLNAHLLLPSLRDTTASRVP